MKKRVVFLMSDTGGGHRAAAEAIRDALQSRYGAQNLDISLLDVYREMMFPMNTMPEFYPWIVNNGKISYGISYEATNGNRRADFFSRWMYLTNGHRLRRMVRNNPADVVVSVHSVITRPSMLAYQSFNQRPPFITVVTDLVSTHMFWYDRRAERTLVPTLEAYDRGLRCGLRPNQLRVTGLPVHPNFTAAIQSSEEARSELGWDPSLPAVMLVAGGDGMGPLYDTARAINEMNLRCQLVIVAGKNAPLKSRLESAMWNQPTHIYGFVSDMPRKMSAADILVTKAGPATICEAAIARVPMILSNAIPGQEDGNVTHVVENGAGVYAPTPSHVADAVRSWLAEGRDGLEHRAEQAHRLARPNAVWEIADEIWEYAHHSAINNNRVNVKEVNPFKTVSDSYSSTR